MVDDLLPDHVGLTHVLDLAVHLVHQTTWMDRGVILRLFPFQHFFPRALLHGEKLGVGGWGVVAHVIIVSPLSPNPFFFSSFRDFFGFRLGLWTRA